MKQSAQPTLQIEDGLYAYELKDLLWEQQFEQPEHKGPLTLILKLLRVDLLQCEKKDLEAMFSEPELLELKDAIYFHTIANKEVQARWFDMQLTLDKNNIKNYISLTKEAYVCIFEVTREIEYLIRATALVKYAKGFFKNKLDYIFLEVKQAFLDCSSSYYQHLLLIELLSIYGHQKCREEFADFLEEHIKHFIIIHDFKAARFCIKSLNLMEVLDGNDYNIRMGENYELEGDHNVSNMQSGTIYPNIAEPYLKGLRKIASANDCHILKSRLEHKVENFLLEGYKAVQLGGVNLISKIDLNIIHRKILEMNIEDAANAYSALLNLPIPPKSDIEEFARNNQKALFNVDSYFPIHNKINTKVQRLPRKMQKLPI